MKKIVLVAAVLFSTLVGNAFGMDNKDVMISDAWLRVAPNKVGGAFFEIMNMSDKNLKIVAAKTVGAERTELHNHIMDDGVMRMRRVKEVELAGKGKVSFNPHGYHLMMFKLDKSVFAVGEMIDVEFTFDDKSSKRAKFMVKPFGRMGKKKMGDMKKMDHSKMDMPKKK